MKQARTYDAIVDDIARCYARAVADDLLAEYDRQVEAAAKKPESTRHRSPDRACVSVFREFRDFRAKLLAGGTGGNTAFWSMLQHRSTQCQARA